MTPVVSKPFGSRLWIFLKIFFDERLTSLCKHVMLACKHNMLTE